MRSEPPTFLFSVDLEDIRLMVPDGLRYRDAVASTTELYAGLLREHGAKATFFVVGETARLHADLVRRLAAEGHEIACHTDSHVPLTKRDAASLREDLLRNLDALSACGVTGVRGFRAPSLSLVESTSWAYEVLESLGFTYSSSVLPARNPLHGWPGFGREPRRVGGILEIPLTLSDLPPRVPFAGGVYFRVLPWLLVRSGFRRAHRAGSHVVGYFHPYDVDAGQERFMHPGIGGSRAYDALLRARRGVVLPRLRRVLDMGWRILPYCDFVAGVAAG